MFGNMQRRCHGMTRTFVWLILTFMLVTLALGYAVLQRGAFNGQSSKVRFMRMNKRNGILEEYTTSYDFMPKSMQLHLMNSEKEPRGESLLDSNVHTSVEWNGDVNRHKHHTRSSIGDIPPGPQQNKANSTSGGKVNKRSSVNKRRQLFLSNKASDSFSLILSKNTSFSANVEPENINKDIIQTASDNVESKVKVHLVNQDDDESEKLDVVHDENDDKKIQIHETREGSDQSKLEVDENVCPSKYALQDDNDEWFRTNIAQISGKLESVENDDEELLILTPISNVKTHLERYFQNICSLTFPHKRISIALGEDSSSDRSFELAQRIAKDLSPYFKRINVFKLNGMSSRPAAASTNERHDSEWQSNRRRHLAVARNQLLFAALRTEKWVLWLDSDIKHLPRDLVERLLWPQKSIVVVNCLYRKGEGATDTYDRNTWRDTETSRKYLAAQKKDFLMLEGYGPSKRKFLNDLKEEGDIVRLDGVGGSVLLIEGDVHRKGLIFPAFIFNHHLETEGLAKMAARLNIEIYGLPSVNVIHW